MPPTALLRAARAATTPLGVLPRGHASAARTSESRQGRRVGGISSSGSDRRRRRRSSRGPFDCTAAARPARALQ